LISIGPWRGGADVPRLAKAEEPARVAAILRAFHRAFLLAACVAAAAAYIASRMPDSALWERQGIS